MITASKLSGFFAAHAIGCVSDGDTLIPMLAYTTADGERKMERMAHDDLQSAVAAGKARVESGELNADDIALIYDGRITLDAGKMDAIIIEMQTEFSLESFFEGVSAHEKGNEVWTRCLDESV